MHGPNVPSHTPLRERMKEALLIASEPLIGFGLAGAGGGLCAAGLEDISHGHLSNGVLTLTLGAPPLLEAFERSLDVPNRIDDFRQRIIGTYGRILPQVPLFGFSAVGGYLAIEDFLQKNPVGLVKFMATVGTFAGQTMRIRAVSDPQAAGR